MVERLCGLKKKEKKVERKYGYIEEEEEEKGESWKVNMDM